MGPTRAEWCHRGRGCGILAEERGFRVPRDCYFGGGGEERLRRGGTGSNPPRENGLQRKIRNAVSQEPTHTPRARYASAEYWEQVG